MLLNKHRKYLNDIKINWDYLYRFIILFVCMCVSACVCVLEILNILFITRFIVLWICVSVSIPLTIIFICANQAIKNFNINWLHINIRFIKKCIYKLIITQNKWLLLLLLLLLIFIISLSHIYTIFVQILSSYHYIIKIVVYTCAKYKYANK